MSRPSPCEKKRFFFNFKLNFFVLRLKQKKNYRCSPSPASMSFLAHWYLLVFQQKKFKAIQMGLLFPSTAVSAFCPFWRIGIWLSSKKKFPSPAVSAFCPFWRIGIWSSSKKKVSLRGSICILSFLAHWYLVVFQVFGPHVFVLGRDIFLRGNARAFVLVREISFGFCRDSGRQFC